jgi:hypothetical protein
VSQRNEIPRRKQRGIRPRLRNKITGFNDDVEIMAITMIKYIAAILLIVLMVVGLFVWLEDHDNTILRVKRLGIVIVLAVALLFTIYVAGVVSIN